MDDDYEKPWLGCQPCSEKLPLILSGEDDCPLIQVPSSITQYLRDYQLDGVRFLYNKFKNGEGGILGDDMGLGKTIQSIAFMAAVLQMKGTKEDKLRHCMAYIREDIAPGIKIPSVNPILLVCPASLQDNWVDELHTWAHFAVHKLTTANRLDLINRAKRRECDVVIITFELARSSIDFLNMVDWTCVLVDEVHRIKDNGSQITRALNSLHCQKRFGLTGTPFQVNVNDLNSMKEIVCLFNWCHPNSMVDFDSDIERDFAHGNRHSATKRDKLAQRDALIRFQNLKNKFIRRRTKDVLAKHLPSKTDQVVFCELTEIQKDIYKMITQLPDVQELLNCVKDKDARKSVALNKRSGRLFTYLHLLQKSANHIGLLISGISTESNQSTQAVCRQALESFAGLEGIPEKKWMDALSDTSMSGKMLVLSQLLPVFLKRKDKILIFSYSTKVLDFVQRHLIKMSYKFCRLDGTTPTHLRLPMVQSFNSTPETSIFLLSTKAGGVGLNLTGANVVIIYDPSWNPANDMQAQDRAYRLGQQRNVRVYRLLSTSTIDEFVYLRQVYKQQLASLSMMSKSGRSYFDAVSGDTRYRGEIFGIRNLFSFRESGRSLTEELLLKQHQLEEKLRLKLETPVKEEGIEAYVARCAIVKNIYECDENISKSGLVQLCQDVFDTPNDLVEDEHEDWQEAQESNEVSIHLENTYHVKDDSSGSNCCIDTVLEKSFAVRHVVMHQGVVAPSKIEEFVTDCAVRDVFHKGINSQLPAFDCSMGSLNVLGQCEEDKTSSTIPREKFLEFAKKESLTPVDFASKVLSMSGQEKISLLNKYQKRQQGVLEGQIVQKRVRLPSESKSKAEVILPKKKAVEVPCCSTSIPLQSRPLNPTPQETNDSVKKPRILAPDHPKDYNSGELEKPSSFEKEAKAVCPSLSSEAIRLVEQVICRKGKKDAPNQMVTITQENTFETNSKNCGDNMLESNEDECDVPNFVKDRAIDRGTGCSLEAVALIDSLISYRGIRKPSPQKNMYKSSFINSEASSSSARFCKNPTFKCEPEEPLFKAEDDVYLKLIRSGRLTQL